MLSQAGPSFAPYDKERGEYKYEATTSAWYNCRERGICLVVRHPDFSRKCLVITFGEIRNTDGIFIDSWHYEGYFLNPPSVEDFTEEAYKARECAPYGRIDLARNIILGKLEAFFVAREAELAHKEASSHPLNRPEVVEG
jgi:hypothetical protein